MHWLLVVALCVNINAFNLNDFLNLTHRQTVAVKGVLQCEGLPLSGNQVKLVDIDGPDPDDIIAINVTDERGYFFLSGFESEISSIDPVVIIRHKCNDGGIPCEREWRIGVPKHYITFDSDLPKQVMDLGVLNAEVIFYGEKRECIM